MADPLHAVGDGAFLHHDSSWIFPNEIAGLVRIGAPQDIDGTSDAVAYYVGVVNNSRLTASVDVYPPDSASGAAALADAKAAIERELKSADAVQAWSASPFRVGKQPALVGIKSVHASGAGASGAQVTLYFIDTGAWIVKIRATTPRIEPDMVQRLDDFVSQQQWESLGLSDQTCTGPACEAPRVVEAVPK